MTIHRLDVGSLAAFAEADEVFPGVQLGHMELDGKQKYCVVVGGLVSVVIDATLTEELASFYREVWEVEAGSLSDPQNPTERYNAWLKTLAEMSSRETAEAQLRQLQKLEAMGQLTGGIAHDFNNMMAVILGGLTLARRRLLPGQPEVLKFIDGAMDGAQRAAKLTAQLLAYSRQQPLMLKVLSPNVIICTRPP